METISLSFQVAWKDRYNWLWRCWRIIRRYRDKRWITIKVVFCPMLDCRIYESVLWHKSLGFRSQSFPMTYLGCLLYSGRWKKSYFSAICTSVASRVLLWKERLLSSGGKLVLIRSVLASMPIHIFAASNPPKGFLSCWNGFLLISYGVLLILACDFIGLNRVSYASLMGRAGWVFGHCNMCLMPFLWNYGEILGCIDRFRVISCTWSTARRCILVIQISLLGNHTLGGECYTLKW